MTSDQENTRSVSISESSLEDMCFEVEAVGDQEMTHVEEQRK